MPEIASFSQTIKAMPNNSLKDKVFLVTGAGSGIGKSTSFALARAGATVVLIGRELSKLERVYDEIEANKGARPAIFPMNLESTAEEEYTALYQAITEEFDALDGIVHSAAILGPRKPLAQYPIDSWQKVTQVNCNAPFMVSKALLPALSKARNGKLIFIGDDVGMEGRAFWGAYATSKAALANLANVFNDELDETSKIQSFCFYPGPCRTQLRATAFPAEDPMTIKPPSDLDTSMVFLASEMSLCIRETDIFF